jgi:hypothetical protein
VQRNSFSIAKSVACAAEHCSSLVPLEEQLDLLLLLVPAVPKKRGTLVGH